MNTLLIGVAGGSGSGKSTVSRRLREALPDSGVIVLQQDAYYRDRRDLSPEDRAALNYDHPDSIDEALLIEHLRALRDGRPIRAPVYDFVHHLRSPDLRPVEPRRCVIVEGILILASEPIRALLDLRLYVETDADVRFIRRLRRDVEERGRTVESVIEQWERTVRPMYLQFVEPSRRHAHLIIPEGGHNAPALDVVISRLRAELALPTSSRSRP